METASPDNSTDESPPVADREDQQRDLNQTGAAKKHKSWEFKVRSEFIQGTTHKLRARGRKTVALSFEARALFIYLDSFASKNSPVPYPSMETIRFDTGWGVSTIQKYRRELQNAGYLELRQGTWNGRFSSNLYTLIHSLDPMAAKQSVEKQSTEPQPADLQSADHKSTKRYHSDGRGTSVDSEDRHEVLQPGSSRNTPPSARAAAADESTPSATQSGVSPEPPGPRSKAVKFIQDFRHWGKAARIPATLIPTEQEALIAFFRDNEEITAQHLGAIMLAAWMMEDKKITPGTETHEAYWHCMRKSKRIKTFLQFLPNIQDELEWKGDDQQIERVYRCAEKRFKREGTDSNTRQAVEPTAPGAPVEDVPSEQAGAAAPKTASCNADAASNQDQNHQEDHPEAEQPIKVQPERKESAPGPVEMENKTSDVIKSQKSPPSVTVGRAPVDRPSSSRRKIFG